MGPPGIPGQPGPAGATGATGPTGAGGDYTLNGDLKYNVVVSAVVGATSGSYNGHITASVNGKNYYGRAATTVACAVQFGAGARMCSLNDLQMLMQANAIRPVNPDAPADVPSTASSLPTVYTWINSGALKGYNPNAPYLYGDCFNWSGTTVTNGSYGAMIYLPPNSSWPYGYTEFGNCNSSYPLMCCK